MNKFKECISIFYDIWLFSSFSVRRVSRFTYPLPSGARSWIVRVEHITPFGRSRIRPFGNWANAKQMTEPKYITATARFILYRISIGQLDVLDIRLMTIYKMQNENDLLFYSVSLFDSFWLRQLNFHKPKLNSKQKLINIQKKIRSRHDGL